MLHLGGIFLLFNTGPGWSFKKCPLPLSVATSEQSYDINHVLCLSFPIRIKQTLQFHFGA